jgi:hypothetical protein
MSIGRNEAQKAKKNRRDWPRKGTESTNRLHRRATDLLGRKKAQKAQKGEQTRIPLIFTN